jgi:hypothetical protein
MFRVRVVSEVTRASKKEFTARLLTILLGNFLVNHIDPKPGLNLKVPFVPLCTRLFCVSSGRTSPTETPKNPLRHA